MKLAFHHTLLFSFLLSGGVSIHSQGVRDFRAQVSGNMILVSWVTDSGYTCSNTVLSHSPDSLHYSAVYTIPGICGSFQEEKHYSYIHSGLMSNRMHYYRLTHSGTTTALETRIFLPDGETFYIYPNPVLHTGTIFLGGVKQYTLRVESLNGLEVYTEAGTGDRIYVNVGNWSPGIYVYELLLGSSGYRGKFCIP